MQDELISATAPVAESSVAHVATRAAASPWTGRRIGVLVVSYVAALVAMVGLKGLHVSPDRYFEILFVPVLVLGVWRQYLRDFLPFIVAMFVYEFSRGYANTLNATILHRSPHYSVMIVLDKIIGLGEIPTRRLQDLFWTGHITAFDHFIAYFDHLHFFVPPTLLFVIWLDRREHYFRCVFTLLLTSFVGVIAFFLFPAAPPWLASHFGVGGVHIANIGRLENAGNGLPHGNSILESHIPSNAVAAMPSLHAAYALLTFLFAITWRRRVGIVMAIYPLIMWPTIVYIGDHYVVDAIAGVLLAYGAWVISGRLFSPTGRLRRFAGPYPPIITASRTFGGTRP